MPIFIPGRVSWPSCGKLSECSREFDDFVKEADKEKKESLYFNYYTLVAFERFLAQLDTLYISLDCGTHL